jgi:HTH-type transcriptional regulator/antitoxin HigA
VALALRFDRIDNFWFTLMHEVAHVLSESKDLRLDVELDTAHAQKDRPSCEVEADEWACERLIPSDLIRRFIITVRPYYSTRKILEFAEQANVHPGIVVGQLQARGEISWSNLRKMLVPVREQLTGTAPTDGWAGVAPASIEGGSAP